jgi:hypothetical protein
MPCARASLAHQRRALLREATIEREDRHQLCDGQLPAGVFPVVVAALRAMCEPEFNLHGAQWTHHNVQPLTVVSGPRGRRARVQHQLRILRGCLSGQRHGRASVEADARECRRRPHREPRPLEQRSPTASASEGIRSRARGDRSTSVAVTVPRRKRGHRVRVRSAAMGRLRVDLPAGP